GGTVGPCAGGVGVLGVGDGCGGTGAGAGGTGAGGAVVGGRLARGGTGAGEAGAAAGAATVMLASARSWPIAAVTTAVPAAPACSVAPLVLTTSGREEVQTAARASAGAGPPLSSVPASVTVTVCPAGITMTAGVMLSVWSWATTMAFWR